MAKAMKMKDKKNFNKRVHSNQTGNATGADMSDKSKYLAIKYDMEHNGIINEEKRKFLEQYEQNLMLERL
jgi:hypothetical protein